MSRQIIVFDTTTGAILHTMTKDAESVQFTAQEAQAFVAGLVSTHGYENAGYLLITAAEIIQPGRWVIALDTMKLERVDQIIYE